MKTSSGEFYNIVELDYNLPIEYKEELINLLEHILVEARRENMHHDLEIWTNNIIDFDGISGLRWLNPLLIN